MSEEEEATWDRISKASGKGIKDLPFKTESENEVERNARLRAAFGGVDVAISSPEEKRGFLDEDWFFQIGRAMHPGGKWTKEQSQKAMQAIDQSGTSVITRDDFMAFYGKC